MSTTNLTQVNSILIRSANWVGDALMTTPTLRAMRKNFPKAKITLLAKPWVTPVFEHNPDIDEVMNYETHARHAGRLGFLRLTRDVRRRRFDMALLLQNAFEAALLSFLAGIPQRVGYTTDGRSALLTDRMWQWRQLKKGHLIDYYLGLITGQGLPTDGRQMTLVLSDYEINDALALVEAHGISTANGMVGLNPGATYGTAKRWPVENFAQLGRRLWDEMAVAVLVFGTAAEKELGDRIVHSVGAHCINLCGKTKLRQAMALIQCCRLFFTNDSGLMHVAAALNIPQVAFIGPTDPIATGPTNPASVMMRVPDACHLMPCMKRHCPTDHGCMNAISATQAFNAGVNLLKAFKG